MKAIAFETPGGPEVLALRQWPEPELPQGRQLLIQLRAAGG